MRKNMKNISKIFGAVAIIGLFLVCSMSTGLAAQQGMGIKTQQQQIPGSQPSTPPGYSEPPANYYQWNGEGGLPTYDGDGQDGMMFYGNSYPLPVQGDLPSYFSVNFDTTGIIFNNPQYVVYYVAIKRTDDGGLLGKHQQFKAVIANIGKADNPLSSVGHKITCWKCCIPMSYTESKQGIFTRFVGLRIITSPQVGGNIGTTVVVNPDYQNNPNQQFPGLFRVRRSVSSWICPFSSLSYDFLIDTD